MTYLLSGVFKDRSLSDCVMIDEQGMWISKLALHSARVDNIQIHLVIMARGLYGS